MDNILYKVIVSYYDEYENDDVKSTFFAFAPNIINLSERIDRQFSYITHIDIKIVNPIATDEDFLYVDKASAYSIKEIEDSNDY